MSCPAILSGYTRPCRDLQAGVKKFYVTEHANIASYTVVSGVVTALTMSSGKKFWLYEQEMNVCNYNSDPTTSENGTFGFDQTFNASFLKRSASFSYGLKALGQQDLVIIPVENTGTMFALGITNGMKMQPSKSGSGTQYLTDKNGYDLVFKGQEPEDAPTISQAILDTIIV